MVVHRGTPRRASQLVAPSVFSARTCRFPGHAHFRKIKLLSVEGEQSVDGSKASRLWGEEATCPVLKSLSVMRILGVRGPRQRQGGGGESRDGGLWLRNCVLEGEREWDQRAEGWMRSRGFNKCSECP